MTCIKPERKIEWGGGVVRGGRGGDPTGRGERNERPGHNRACCHYELGEYQKSIQDCTAAIGIDEKDCTFWFERAMAFVRAGNFDQARLDLLEGIRRNPGDAGKEYEPTSGKRLSDEALRHGRLQVRRILEDRPGMRFAGQDLQDPLCEWAARKFAGEDLGEIIDWNPEPTELFHAQNLYPDSTRRGYIQVSDRELRGPKTGEPRSFEQMWEGLVYELHNIGDVAAKEELREAAIARSITKEEYVWRMLESEFRAKQRTRAFYATVYLPWCEAHGSFSIPEHWGIQMAPSFGGYQAIRRDRTRYPWVPYADYYDELTGGDPSPLK